MPSLELSFNSFRGNSHALETELIRSNDSDLPVGAGFWGGWFVPLDVPVVSGRWRRLRPQPHAPFCSQTPAVSRDHWSWASAQPQTRHARLKPATLEGLTQSTHTHAPLY